MFDREEENKRSQIRKRRVRGVVGKGREEQEDEFDREEESKGRSCTGKRRATGVG